MSEIVTQAASPELAIRKGRALGWMTKAETSLHAATRQLMRRGADNDERTDEMRQAYEFVNAAIALLAQAHNRLGR